MQQTFNFREMEMYGLCLLGTIPVRREPAHSGELVNQMVFGDIFAVLETKDEWVKIAGIFDGNEGYITQNSFDYFEQPEFDKLENTKYWILCDPIIKIKNVNTSEVFYIPGGSMIFGYKEDDFTFNMLNNWFQFMEKPRLNNIRGAGEVTKIAYRYIHAPYLWGGRTILGIDCSGFSQVVYKMLNIALPRDAAQQVNKGTTVNFLAEARGGDLAFFDDSEGKIIHVGIILSNSEIIHASGMIRIDAIDQTGIYNRSQRKYSHNLRIIKRILV